MYKPAMHCLQHDAWSRPLTVLITEEGVCCLQLPGRTADTRAAELAERSRQAAADTTRTAREKAERVLKGQGRLLL